jgi:hypothetical protein
MASIDTALGDYEFQFHFLTADQDFVSESIDVLVRPSIISNQYDNIELF